MGYVINYKDDKNFVFITVKGKLNFKMAEQYSIEAIKLAHRNNCHKFLINHEETRLEKAGIYKLHTDGAALEKFGFKNSDIIGIVISILKEDRLFSERIEHNAKWCNFRYFSNVEDAQQWIESDN